MFNKKICFNFQKILKSGNCNVNPLLNENYSKVDIGSCLPPSVRLRPARHYHGQPIGTNCEPTCRLQLIWGQLWDNFFSWELHNFSKELGQYSTVHHSKVQYSTETYRVISLQLLLNISQFRHNYRVPLLANSWQVLFLSGHTKDVVLGELFVSLEKKPSKRVSFETN